MCDSIDLPNGDSLLVCGLRTFGKHCVKCARPAVALCDWKVKEHKTGTCDNPICARHAMSVDGGRKRLCPTHQRSYDGWKAKRHTDAEQRSLFSEAA